MYFVGFCRFLVWIRLFFSILLHFALNSMSGLNTNMCLFCVRMRYIELLVVMIRVALVAIVRDSSDGKILILSKVMLLANCLRL